MSKQKHKSKKHAVRSKPKAAPRGVFEANPRGFGFVKTPEGEYFVAAKNTRDAMDGDTVEISVFKSDKKNLSSRVKGAKSKRGSNDKREEARILRVVQRAHADLIGVYEVAEPFGIVIPEDPRIKHDVFTMHSDNPDIAPGTMVRVEILEYPTRKSAATGRIIEVFDEDGTDIAIERIISRYNLETDFSKASMEQARDTKLDVKNALDNGYRDVRDRFVFTIDPVDAKDFDDALSFEVVSDDEYRLGVHIADVSAYVEWDSSIDLDARRRATSTYLADRVIPMLPAQLSENLCSLRPNEDRLCMTCDILVDSHANFLDCDIYPAIMNSNARLTYEQAQMIIEDDAPGASEDLLSSRILALSRLAKERQRNRESAGGIEFKTKEAKVSLDASGKPTGIVVREKTDATELVEEAMIFANEVVATYLGDRDLPCAYRVHEPPAADALEALVPILQEFSWFTTEMARDLPYGNPHVIQHILDEASGRAEEEMVTMLLLRAMMRAHYTPHNDGHYGLGLNAYCHFTSPIRRYPDLIVHRMLKYALGFKQNDFKKQAKSLSWLCEHSSEQERNAEAASFDSQKAKIAEYMAQFVGQDFDGIISGVMQYGLYVRLNNCAEGLIPVRTLGTEYFNFDEAKHTLTGSDSKVRYRLGEKVHVRLTKADVEFARLDFALVEDN